MKKESILGFDICNSTYNELTDLIFTDFKNNIINFIVNINPEIIINYYKNEKIKKTFNEQKYQIPDGIGIVWASKKNKGKIKIRITGIDLMKELCKKSIYYNSKIFLYGGKNNIAKIAKAELENSYKNINIVGTCNGYTDENLVLENIKNSQANILFVGLGSPKQEEFIINNRYKLPNIKIFMPIGGSLDVISKSIKRAPNWIIKCNLEWLYRIIKQPKRIFRGLKLIKFAFKVLINKNNNGGNKNEKN